MIRFLYILTAITLFGQAASGISFVEWAKTNALSSAGILEQADPDGDGLCNLVEYATGSDPSQHSPSPLNGLIGSTNILISYPRQLGGDELTFQLQSTGSLVSNDWNVVTTDPVVSTNENFEQVTFDLPANDTCQFIRLQLFSTQAHYIQGFENSLEGWVSAGGSVTISTNQAYSGSSALQVSGDDGLARYSFESPRQGSVTVWFYDDVADLSLTSFLTLTDSASGHSIQLGVSTDDSATYYCSVSTNGAVSVSGVERTTDWHEFRIEPISAQQTLLTIDGQSAGSVYLPQFDAITLGDGLTNENSGTVYFDAITIQIDSDALQTDAVLLHSFETSLDGWIAGATNTILTRVTDHATDGSYAIRADHTDSSLYAGLMQISHNTSTEWWSVMQNEGSSTLSVDFFVPESALDASWAKLSMRLQGSGFDLSVETNLTTRADNTGTLCFDFSSIKSSLSDASWGQLTIAINAGSGSSRTPVTIDNFKIMGTGFIPPEEPEIFITPEWKQMPEPTRDDTQLLINGGFELDEDVCWDADSAHSIVSDETRSGDQSLKAHASGASIALAAQQAFYATPDMELAVTGWAKAPDSFSGTLQLVIASYDTNWNQVIGNTIGTVSSATDWQLLSGSFTTPAETAYVKIMIRCLSTSMDCWVDDISCTRPANIDPPIPAPDNPPAGIQGTWIASFEDNFTQDTLDAANWKIGTHTAGLPGIGGNTGSNVSVTNGAATIKATLEPVQFGPGANNYNMANTTIYDGGYWASTGEISTFRLRKWKYGYMEARLRYDHRVGMWPGWWTMPDRGIYDTNSVYRSYLKFDLSSLSGPIDSAELKLKVSGTPNDISLVNVCPVTNDTWTSFTWDSRPLEDPIWIAHDCYPSGHFASTNEVTFDLTDHINQQLADGDQIISLVLFDSFMRGAKLEFYSQETGTNAPTMIINSNTAFTVTHDLCVSPGPASINSNVLSVQDDWPGATNCTTLGDGMEIDIFEAMAFDWKPWQFQHALHWDGYGADHQSIGYSNHMPFPGFSTEEYHAYGVLWEPGQLTFYLDGTPTHTNTSSEVCAVDSYLLLSLQIGDWNTTNNWENINWYEYPAYMDVDYVKVWTNSTHY
jgi:beta-glucanase (GH16 family)